MPNFADQRSVRARRDERETIAAPDPNRHGGAPWTEERGSPKAKSPLPPSSGLSVETKTGCNMTDRTRDVSRRLLYKCSFVAKQTKNLRNKHCGSPAAVLILTSM